jgi:methylenetetrahydrofolate dehydrogenase (NAD+)
MFELRVCDKHELEEKLFQANTDSAVHGIIIFYPGLPLNFPWASFFRFYIGLSNSSVFGAEPSFDGSSRDDYLRDSITPEKDVEGLCHLFRSNM